MSIFNEVKSSLLHLFFPHICSGCGSDILDQSSMLCLRCLEALPFTQYEQYPNNPIEKKFIGRLTLQQATAQYYFTKETLIQHLIHQVKYKRNKELGIQLGHLMGNAIKKAERFNVDAIVPIPLFAAKERKRGYNQATLLAEGMSEEMNIPVFATAVIRPEKTETQTKKARIERWKNVDGKFIITQPEKIEGKHILLVDDVITTGATIEACGQELLKLPNVSLSVAAFCYA